MIGSREFVNEAFASAGTFCSETQGWRAANAWSRLRSDRGFVERAGLAGQDVTGLLQSGLSTGWRKNEGLLKRSLPYA